MPLGSSSEAPVIRPGPRRASHPRRRPTSMAAGRPGPIAVAFPLVASCRDAGFDVGFGFISSSFASSLASGVDRSCCQSTQQRLQAKNQALTCGNRRGGGPSILTRMYSGVFPISSSQRIQHHSPIEPKGRSMTDEGPRCPQCHALGTRAYSVKYSDGKKTVSYRCDGCGHTWQTATKPIWPPVAQDQAQ